MEEGRSRIRPTLKRFRHFVNSDARDGNVRVRRGARPDPARHRAKSARRREAAVTRIGCSDRWHGVCALDDILPTAPACARWSTAGRSRCSAWASAVYALDNFDPCSEANVLSRGIVGDLQGRARRRLAASTSSTSACRPAAASRIRPFASTCIPRASWTGESGSSVRAAAGRPRGRRRLVVVGNGMAGMRTVEELLKLGARRATTSPCSAPSRTATTTASCCRRVLAGEKRSRTSCCTGRSGTREHGITLHAGDPVVRDRPPPAHGALAQRRGGAVRPAADRDRIEPDHPADARAQTCPASSTFRDLDDVDAMLEARGARHGAPWSSAADCSASKRRTACALRGMDVTVVHLLRHADGAPARRAGRARCCEPALETRGIEVPHAARRPRRSWARSASARVRFEDGERSDGGPGRDGGGRAAEHRARKTAGLRCDRGILVDDTLQTYDPASTPSASACSTAGSTFGLVAPLWEQARVCAAHLAESGVSRYRGSLHRDAAQGDGHRGVLGRRFRRDARSAKSLVLRDPRRGIYKRLVFADNRLRGAVLYGDARDGPGTSS